MWSFTLRYVTPIFLAVAPLLTSQYSLLDVLGYHPDDKGVLHLALASYVLMVGPKAEVEMRLRVYMTLTAISFIVVHGYFDAYRPSRTLRTFRQEYLEHVGKNEWRKGNRLKKDIRINVMFKRFWWVLPLAYFEFVWQDGFEATDRDGSLRLFFFQGACGRAARTKEAVLADLRASQPPLTFREQWLLGNEFHLFGWQLNKTRRLKAILSIPILERYGTKGREKYRSVGVINLDTTTDSGADHLIVHKKDLAVFFAKYGTLVAKMR